MDLYVLALLACPVGMGLMMFLMMRSGSGRNGQQGPDSREVELARIRGEIAQLRSDLNSRPATGEPTPQAPSPGPGRG